MCDIGRGGKRVLLGYRKIKRGLCDVTVKDTEARNGVGNKHIGIWG